MTKENKAKAYDYAIKRANELLYVASKGSIVRDTIEDLFPELKENDDKKIMEDIIQCVKYSGDSFIPFNKTTVGDMVSYLEKQGEQKPTNIQPKFKPGDRIRSINGIYEDEVLKVLPDGYRLKELGELNIPEDKWEIIDAPVDGCESVEQKPTEHEWSEEDEKMFEHALDMIEWYSGNNESKSRAVSDWLKSLKNRFVPQPKQEWSEEDENIFRDIVARLHSHPNVDKTEYDKSYHWLESLKDRVIPQPQWSEKDEKMFNGIIDAASHHCCLNMTDVDWLKNRFKSLRPQKQWKPSQEQMVALYEETQKSDRIKDDRIVSLYNDLKKL